MNLDSKSSPKKTRLHSLFLPKSSSKVNLFSGNYDDVAIHKLNIDDPLTN